MPFYIRLLRPSLLTESGSPKGFKRSKASEFRQKATHSHGKHLSSSLAVAFALTICTDLGDSFLDPSDDVQRIKLEIQYRLKQDDASNGKAAGKYQDAKVEMLGEDVFQWTRGMRVLTGKVGVRQVKDLEALSKVAHRDIWIHAFAIDSAGKFFNNDQEEAEASSGQGLTNDCRDYLGPSKLSLIVPEIVSVLAKVSLDSQGVKAQVAQRTTDTERLVLRRFRFAAGRMTPDEGKDFDRESSRGNADIQIWEELGESIARHVWYACLDYEMIAVERGVSQQCLLLNSPLPLSNTTDDLASRDAALALVACLSKVVSSLDGEMDEDKVGLDHASTDPSWKNLVHRVLCSKSSIQIVELGSGCGIVGLAMSKLLSNFVHKLQVVLTDLPEAMEILERNIAEAMAEKASKNNVDVQKRILDWNEVSKTQDHVQESREDPDQTKLQPDLVVVSDCTYNVDSLPALVHTIRRLVKNKGASGTGILVSLKRRHSSEDVFFSLMDEDGFKIVGKAMVPLPDKAREKRGGEKECVGIFWFAEDTGIDTRR